MARGNSKKEGQKSFPIPCSPVASGFVESMSCAELLLFLGAHLGRGSSDSTFALSKPLHFRALFWPRSYSLLPFPVMYFQDAHLFIHASVRLKFTMVHKLTWLLNGAGSLRRSLPSWVESLLLLCWDSLHSKGTSPAPGLIVYGTDPHPQSAELRPCHLLSFRQETWLKPRCWRPLTVFPSIK